MLTPIIFLIEQFAVGLYFLIAFGILLWWRRWRLSRRAYRETYFELERGMARYRTANAITALLLLIEAALIIYGIQSRIAPTLAEQDDFRQELQITPNDSRFITPTPQIVAVGIDDSNIELESTEIGILITPTLTPTPVGTILPNVDAPIDCDPTRADLQIPANGMVVFEPIEIRGIANVDNFALYKFELRGEGTFDNFIALSEGFTSATDLKPLGQFVPSSYASGEYLFRLAVFDINSMLQASCTITIFISDPIPTATPIGLQ